MEDLPLMLDGPATQDFQQIYPNPYEKYKDFNSSESSVVRPGRVNAGCAPTHGPKVHRTTQGPVVQAHGPAKGPLSKPNSLPQEAQAELVEQQIHWLLSQLIRRYFYFSVIFKILDK